MVKRNIKWDNVWEWLFFLAIVVAVGMIVCTNLFHYNYKLNADIASEAVYARLIWESKEWLPKSWYSGTELRFWQTPNLAALFYGITHSMSLAMGAACIAMTVGIVFSAYFFINQFSFEKAHKLAFVLLCLVISNQFMILELTYLFASYYGIHVVILFFTLGVYIRLMSGKRKAAPFIVATVILSVMTGMLSVREILICYAPLFCAEAVRQLYLYCTDKSEWKNKKNLLIGVWCVSLPAASFMGTFFPYSIEQDISRNVRKGLDKLFNTVLPDLAECLGFIHSHSPEELLIFVLLIASIVSLILCIIQVLVKRDAEHAVWSCLALWIAPVMAMFAVAFTTMDSSPRYYFVLLYALSFGTIYLIKLSQKRSRILQAIGYAVVLILFILQTKSVYFPIMQSDEPPMTDAYKVGSWLEDNGYELAYANFSNANTITVLTGGTVRVGAVASVGRMDFCKWLNSTDWYVPNVPYESPTAYIVTKYEFDEFGDFYEKHQDDLHFATVIGMYNIYVSDYNFSCLEPDGLSIEKVEEGNLL